MPDGPNDPIAIPVPEEKTRRGLLAVARALADPVTLTDAETVRTNLIRSRRLLAAVPDRSRIIEEDIGAAPTGTPDGDFPGVVFAKFNEGAIRGFSADHQLLWIVAKEGTKVEIFDPAWNIQHAKAAYALYMWRPVTDTLSPPPRVRVTFPVVLGRRAAHVWNFRLAHPDSLHALAIGEVLSDENRFTPTDSIKASSLDETAVGRYLLAAVTTYNTVP